MNNQKLFLAAAAFIACLLAVSVCFTFEGFREYPEQKVDLFSLEHYETRSDCNHQFNFSPASPANLCAELGQVAKIHCQSDTSVSLQRTVVSVSKPIQGYEVTVDTDNLKSLNSNASLNLMIENYTVRRSLKQQDRDCEDYSYQFIVETFSTTVEAFMSETASTSIHVPNEPFQRPSFFTRLSQYFGARNSKASA